MSWFDHLYRTRAASEGAARRSRAGLTLGVAMVSIILTMAGLWIALQHEHSHFASTSSGPPWVLGRRDARFTIIEFADLQCPYCKTFFPRLQALVREHPDVNWQWHHLPLSIHEPAATQAARLAECAGENAGNEEFWNVVAWMYSHDDSSAGSDQRRPPWFSRRIEDCLKSGRPDHIISEQVASAAQAQVVATPTVRIVDHESGRSITLEGLLDADALLSAIDWIASPQSKPSAPNE
jgi:protein-disulfide isomerase